MTIVVRQRRAFSLIEVLMSIFILGIGVIAIASLLPAGIKQQQNAKNDAYGPVVAEIITKAEITWHRNGHACGQTFGF